LVKWSQPLVVFCLFEIEIHFQKRQLRHDPDDFPIEEVKLSRIEVLPGDEANPGDLRDHRRGFSAPANGHRMEALRVSPRRRLAKIFSAL
jgi:hypothetical protein